MNIGVLGTKFGAYHAELWSRMEGVEQVTVYGRNEEKLSLLQKKLGVQVTSRIEDMIGASGTDLIDICLPSALHAEYTEAALRAGQAVLCETPVCLTPDDLERMQAARTRYGGRVLVSQFIHFEPAYKLLREAVQSGQYGRLLSLSLMRETAPLWGNLGFDAIAANLMIHELDFVYALLGNPAKIKAWGDELPAEPDRGLPDRALAHAFLDYDGTSVQVTASSRMPAEYPFSVGYTAYFEYGKLDFRETDGREHSASTLVCDTAAGRELLPTGPLNAYAASLAHALSCLRSGELSPLELDNAGAALTLAVELQRQLAGGRMLF